MKSIGNKALAAITAAIAACVEDRKEAVAIVAALNAYLEEEGIASWKGAPPSHRQLGTIRIRAL